MLSSLLEFNPYLRPTAKELLKHPIFDSIRIPSNEGMAPCKIIIDVDKKRSTDYEKAIPEEGGKSKEEIRIEFIDKQDFIYDMKVEIGKDGLKIRDHQRHLHDS